MKLFFTMFCMGALVHISRAQDCKTDAELDGVPGKYLTADQYPWPAVRSGYFSNMSTPADKAMAKQTLGQIEKIEQQSHAGFNLTGGSWENYYSTDGYANFGNTKLGKYTFQASLHEYFCAKGKMLRNGEASTILRIYTNDIPVNTLDPYMRNPFGGSMGDYDFGLQYLEWKTHLPADVNAPFISLLTYMTCGRQQLIEAINSGSAYFQDVAEKDIRPNNRSTYVSRYWFVKKKDIPVLLPVTRGEYLQSLLEYYEREKLYFPKLIAKLTKDHDNAVTRFRNWEQDVNDKINTVKKELNGHDEAWLSAQAVINLLADNSQTYKAKLWEKTNYNRFWKFYDNEKGSEPLYKYNPKYFKNAASGPAKPQIISVAFRFVTMPSSLRLLNNFTKSFDFDAVRKMLE